MAWGGIVGRGQVVALAVSFCIGWAGVAFGAPPPVDTAWIRHYNGPGNGSDLADAIAVDHQGNVYVAGQSWNGKTQDYVTLKYNSNGGLEWERRYAGPAEFGNEATAIEIDAAGEICITGTNAYGSAHQGYCVLRYNQNGDLLREEWHNWPGRGPSHIHGVRTDSAGSVWVIGLVGTAQADRHFATMRFAPSGESLWEVPFGSAEKSADIASALVIDPAGNSYVTGQTWERTGSRFLTVKYNQIGGIVWKDRYDGTGKALDVPKTLRVDASGAVYVTGCSHGPGSDCDIITLKYSRDGRRLWESRYSGQGRTPERVTGLQVDAAGNVYVAGFSRGEGQDFDYLTLKYGPQGNLLWEQRYAGASGSRDEARALAVDAAGGVYVTGSSWLSGEDYDFLTVKYRQDVSHLR